MPPPQEQGQADQWAQSPHWQSCFTQSPSLQMSDSIIVASQPLPPGPASRKILRCRVLEPSPQFVEQSDHPSQSESKQSFRQTDGQARRHESWKIVQAKNNHPCSLPRLRSLQSSLEYWSAHRSELQSFVSFHRLSPDPAGSSLHVAWHASCSNHAACPPSSDLPSEDSWPPPVRKVCTMAGAKLGQSGCLVTHEKKRASASKRASPKAARCRKVWPPPQLLGRIRVDRKAVAHELLAAAGTAPRPRARLPRTPVTQQVPAQSFPKSVTTELHKSHLYVDTTFARVMSEACPDLGLNQT